MMSLAKPGTAAVGPTNLARRHFRRDAPNAARGPRSAIGIEAYAAKPEEFRQKVAKEAAQFRRIAVEAGIKPD
ncbi:hypothetical protein BH10PSE18_BH10PSE18_48640 [soil metagenome]